MRLLVVLGLAAAAAVAVLLRRRAMPAEQWAPSAEPAAAVPQPPHLDDVPVSPDAPSTAPDPDARELESELTEDTRFDRLVENERQERQEAAERLRNDPLTGELETGPGSSS